MKTPTPQVLARRLREVGPVRRAAEAELASLPDGLMAERALQAWTDYPTVVRRGLWQAAAIVVAAVALTVAVNVLPASWLPGWLGEAAEAVSILALTAAAWFAALGFLGTFALVGLRYEQSLRPLLLHLDDVRLVPLWLASVCADAVLSERAALLEKLAKWLPRWHETQTPLPERARRDLAREMARCGEHAKLSDAEAAFLTAALVTLDADPARGIPPDATLRRWAAQLTSAPGRVGEAADDALQRLGPLS